MTQSIHRPRLFVAACAGMALFGMSLAVPGTILGFPEIRETLHMDVQQQGLVSSCLLLGVWITTLVVGPVIDRFGNKVVLATSAALACIGFGAFLFANTFALVVAAVLIVGLGAGGLNTSTNAAVSSLYEEKRAPMLNILGVFFGGGAFLLPTIAARFSPYGAIGFGCVFAALATLGYLLLKFPPAREAHTFTLSQAMKVITYPGVLLFAVVMFCESANEQTMNSFSSTWLGAAGAAATRAAVIYSFYHLAMAVGRVLAVPVLTRVSKEKVIRVSAVGTVCGTVLLALSAFNRSVPLMSVAVVLTALSFAAIYPTLLALVGDRYQHFSGTVFGLLFSVAMLGAIFAPSAVGVIAKHQSDVLAATVVPVIGTALVLVFSVLVTRRAKTQEREPQARAAREEI